MNVRILLLFVFLFPVHSALGESFNSRLSVVPLLQLITAPESFDKKHISVIGVFKFDLDLSTIYLSREHHDLDLFDTSISVEFLEKGNLDDIERLTMLDGCYVRVDGFFLRKIRDTWV